MDATYRLVVRFGEDAGDIVASEREDDMLELKQGDDLIWFPKSEAADFIEKLSRWASYGREAA